jgi:hypothetical protein
LIVENWGDFVEQHVPRRWEELELQPLEAPSELREWLTQLASQCVWAKAAGWQANEDAYADLVTGHGRRMRHFTFLPELLRSPELLTAIPELADDESLPQTEFGLPEYAFGLDGAMAWRLWGGGAYTQRESWVSPGRAKELSSAAVRALVGDRYTDAHVYTKKEPDTWEALWVLLDYGTSRIWVTSCWDTD